jgi:hypothetical protein
MGGRRPVSGEIANRARVLSPLVALVESQPGGDARRQHRIAETPIRPPRKTLLRSDRHGLPRHCSRRRGADPYSSDRLRVRCSAFVC